MAFQFLHAADIHLDSPLRGLHRYPGAPVEQIRHASRRALSNLVELAIAEQVAFVVIAGDLYDGDWDNCNTGFFFVAEMAKLREAGIPVFLIAGNHDAASKMTKSLPLPPNVVRFPTHESQTHPLHNYRVAIHGQGFATAAVTTNLALGYPEAVPGYFNLGLLHTCATGREGHAAYAPCTVEELRSKHYQYWALGHIHAREVLHHDPWIVFSGNIQGRHIRETGPKGGTLVTVEDNEVVDVQPRWLDVMRWQRCEVPCHGAESDAEVLYRFSKALQGLLDEREDRPLAVRVQLQGACPAHAELLAHAGDFADKLRAQAIDESNQSVWIEKVEMQTAAPRDAERQLQLEGPMAELKTLIREYQSRPKQLQALAKELADLKRKLPPELRHGDEALDFESSEQLKALVAEAGQFLSGRLLGKGAAE